MNKNDALTKVREIIDDLMAESDPLNLNFISNLRMFYQIAEDGNTDRLKNVLVEQFAEYYGHTIFSNNPVDILTIPHIEATVNIMWAGQDNKNKTLN